MGGVYSDTALTLPTEWLAWLATSAARLAIYRMGALHAPLRLLHLVSTAAFFGGILLLDLRLLGAGRRDLPADALARLVLPVVYAALAVLLLSGTWLFLYDPIQTGSHTWFLPKLLLIAGGLLNAALFNRFRRHPRPAAALSILLWLGVIACATANQEERPLVRSAQPGFLLPD